MRTEQVVFATATPGDDEEIRRLLAQTPMGGEVSLSLERNPYFFLETDSGLGVHQTVVARHGGRIVCVGQGVVRRLFYNGTPRDVGYLGGLRLLPEMAGRHDILRRGYEFFRNLSWPRSPEIYFTSIVSDNLRARQFLERDLKGMPRYHFESEWVSLLIPVPRRVVAEREEAELIDYDEWAECLNSQNVRYQFAPCWTGEDLHSLDGLGLKMENVVLKRSGARIVACASFWDQRSFKQVVIRRYGWRLSMMRPVLNALLRLGGYPGLPTPGNVLEHGYISHLVLDERCPELVPDLIRGLFSRARKAGVEFLTVGFPENDPRREGIRRNFRCREYRSRLYQVSWNEGIASDQRPVFPEIAFL